MIVAVDFDGILCTNEFPGIGKPNYRIISLVRQLIDLGAEVILWTCRCEDELKAAVDWCNDYDIHFCAINDNAPSNKTQYKGVYKDPPRKVYADVYIDDHNLEFAGRRASYSENIRDVKILLERQIQLLERQVKENE